MWLQTEGQVHVVLSRVNMPSMKVMSPVKKYNGKSEGHWLVLGCEEQVSHPHLILTYYYVIGIILTVSS